ncbi:hypothetical protein CCUS01_15196 [Colletotrichum cuscutae]|uniref:Uncharacterized protein n=1 Tax=Colletotrichum cuscutae TaxID=1209917 RepID=A0AAI9VER0_9PEZI|nr:hypothetical protein CCUS01_15196 [Colletotrichum cuscutae]
MPPLPPLWLLAGWILTAQKAGRVVAGANLLLGRMNLQNGCRRILGSTAFHRAASGREPPSCGEPEESKHATVQRNVLVLKPTGKWFAGSAVDGMAQEAVFQNEKKDNGRSNSSSRQAARRWARVYVASHGPERGSLKDASFFFSLSSGSYSLWLRKRLTVLPGESDTKIFRPSESLAPTSWAYERVGTPYTEERETRGFLFAYSVGCASSLIGVGRSGPDLTRWQMGVPRKQLTLETKRLSALGDALVERGESGTASTAFDRLERAKVAEWWGGVVRSLRILEGEMGGVDAPSSVRYVLSVRAAVFPAGGAEMKEERDEDGVNFFLLSSEPLLLSEFWRVWSFFLSFSFSLSSGEGEAKEGGEFDLSAEEWEREREREREIMERLNDGWRRDALERGEDWDEVEGLRTPAFSSKLLLLPCPIGNAYTTTQRPEQRGATFLCTLSTYKIRAAIIGIPRKWQIDDETAPKCNWADDRVWGNGHGKHTPRTSEEEPIKQQEGEVSFLFFSSFLAFVLSVYPPDLPIEGTQEYKEQRPGGTYPPSQSSSSLVFEVYGKSMRPSQRHGVEVGTLEIIIHVLFLCKKVRGYASRAFLGTFLTAKSILASVFRYVTAYFVLLASNDFCGTEYVPTYLPVDRNTTNVAGNHTNGRLVSARALAMLRYGSRVQEMNYGGRVRFAAKPPWGRIQKYDLGCAYGVASSFNACFAFSWSAPRSLIQSSHPLDDARLRPERTPMTLDNSQQPRDYLSRRLFAVELTGWNVRLPCTYFACAGKFANALGILCTNEKCVARGKPKPENPDEKDDLAPSSTRNSVDSSQCLRKSHNGIRLPRRLLFFAPNLSYLLQLPGVGSAVLTRNYCSIERNVMYRLDSSVLIEEKPRMPCVYGLGWRLVWIFTGIWISISQWRNDKGNKMGGAGWPISFRGLMIALVNNKGGAKPRTKKAKTQRATATRAALVPCSTFGIFTVEVPSGWESNRRGKPSDWLTQDMLTRRHAELDAARPASAPPDAWHSLQTANSKAWASSKLAQCPLLLKACLGAQRVYRLSCTNRIDRLQALQDGARERETSRRRLFGKGQRVRFSLQSLVKGDRARIGDSQPRLGRRRHSTCATDGNLKVEFLVGGRPEDRGRGAERSGTMWSFWLGEPLTVFGVRRGLGALLGNTDEWDRLRIARGLTSYKAKIPKHPPHLQLHQASSARKQRIGSQEEGQRREREKGKKKKKKKKKRDHPSDRHVRQVARRRPRLRGLVRWSKGYVDFRLVLGFGLGDLGKKVGTRDVDTKSLGPREQRSAPFFCASLMDDEVGGNWEGVRDRVERCKGLGGGLILMPLSIKHCQHLQIWISESPKPKPDEMHTCRRKPSVDADYAYPIVHCRIRHRQRRGHSTASGKEQPVVWTRSRNLSKAEAAFHEGLASGGVDENSMDASGTSKPGVLNTTLAPASVTGLCYQNILRPRQRLCYQVRNTYNRVDSAATKWKPTFPPHLVLTPSVIWHYLLVRIRSVSALLSYPYKCCVVLCVFSVLEVCIVTEDLAGTSVALKGYFGAPVQGLGSNGGLNSGVRRFPTLDLSIAASIDGAATRIAADGTKAIEYRTFPTACRRSHHRIYDVEISPLELTKKRFHPLHESHSLVLILTLDDISCKPCCLRRHMSPYTNNSGGYLSVFPASSTYTNAEAGSSCLEFPIHQELDVATLEKAAEYS